MKDFKNTSSLSISILTLIACSDQTFGMAHAARILTNAKIKAITLVSMIQPYAVTSAAYYVNSQTPATPEKLSKFEFKHVPPKEMDHFGIVRCRTKDEWDNCGALVYKFIGDNRKNNPYCNPQSTDEFIVYINRIDVASEYRRQGIATWMLELAQRNCIAQKKITELQLHSINSGATECYKKFGFEKTDTNDPDWHCFMSKKI
ncbi:MAG TPA: GNAT family N-acetyltransferase [Candidatus Saccharimonadales bacterium]|nr:GNAT family N-acetyltransferase [Candidatus Saccharimonadales bacterium]